MSIKRRIANLEEAVSPPPPPEKFDIGAHLAEGLARLRADPAGAQRRQREKLKAEIADFEAKYGEIDIRQDPAEFNAKTFREWILYCWKRRYAKEGEANP